MTLPGLPLLLRVSGRPVILIGDGEAAEAKRRLLERAGARIVSDDPAARLAIVAIADAAQAAAVADALRARGLLVNVVDRPALCDFTVPAIVDRAPVIVAIATGGASAGLAAALRQRIEAMLPPSLGRLAEMLRDGREMLRSKFPDSTIRRQAIGAALQPGGPLDPLGDGRDAAAWFADPLAPPAPALVRIMLRSIDPEDLTLREARWLALADRVTYRPDVPAAILDRARADAERQACAAPPAHLGEGLTVDVGFPK